MKFLLKCFLILYFPLAFTISIKKIIVETEQESAGSPVVKRHPVPDNLYSEGIFERFIRSLLDLLSNKIPERTLTRYCRILNRALREFDYESTRKLAKHMRYLSRMYREDLKEQMIKYRSEYDKKLPYKTEFLQAMNDIFTLRENLLFSDYLYDLRDYSNGDKLSIYEETRKLINNVIISSINRLRPRDQYELEKKLKRAIKEYTRLSE